MVDSEMLTVRELAALLRVSGKTAYALVREGEVPGFKVGGQWRFRRSDIETWSSNQGSTVTGVSEAGSNHAEARASVISASNSGTEQQITEKSAALGFEDKLWLASDVLRNNMDPAEYKHVVLGLIFLKYVSDAFDEHQSEMTATGSLSKHAARSSIDASNVFRVPTKARWEFIVAHATDEGIGSILNSAMIAIERENRKLAGTLPTVFENPGLDENMLGQLVTLISGIGLGRKEDRDKDTLGRVYEYFLSRFASSEGRSGGEFYTPTSIVRVLVEMLEPYEGKVYDPCCGSGGMFVQSMKFTQAHRGFSGAVRVYGQESNPTTWRLSRMNMAIRGITSDLGDRAADTFRTDLHKKLQADFVLANPPFNISNWGGHLLAQDPRWEFGVPPSGNANFAWLQHIVHHLAPNGTAGVVLANGSMSSQQSGEGEIRRKLIEEDLVDCMVALPGQLFYATQIPVCLWFLARNKSAGGFRDRRGEVLFIDARRLGRMESRVHRVFDQIDIDQLTETYHGWRNLHGDYSDVPGFCKSVHPDEMRANDFVLTPGRYVGAQHTDEDKEPFSEKLKRLAEVLSAQLTESRKLDSSIEASLGSLGFKL